MAYSGSGTQADPYVVTTYSELTDALQMAQSVGQVFYLKVANDINCADDPNYTGVQTFPLYATAATIYADSQVCIEGLTISSTCFMTSTGSNYGTTLSNIYFKNCVYKASGAGAAFYTSGQRYTIDNCKFSMIMTFGSYASYVFDKATLTGCSGYFKFINQNRTASFGAVSNNNQNVFTNCNFIIDSLTFDDYVGGATRGIWGQGYSYTQGKITNTSIIFKNCDISGANTDVYIQPEGNATWIDASYIALLNCTFSSNITTLNGSATGSTGTLSLCGTDNTSLTLNSPNPGTMIVTTLDNLRSKEYLLSVGFLP